MAKRPRDDFDMLDKEQEDEEEAEEDSYTEEEAEEKQQPQRKVIPQKKPVRSEEREEEGEKKRFQAFHTPERIGIVDTKTNQIVGEAETFSILAEILNKLDEINLKVG